MFDLDKIEGTPFPVVPSYCFQTVQGTSFYSLNGVLLVHLAFEVLVGFLQEGCTSLSV